MTGRHLLFNAYDFVSEFYERWTRNITKTTARCRQGPRAANCIVSNQLQQPFNCRGGDRLPCRLCRPTEERCTQYYLAQLPRLRQRAGLCFRYCPRVCLSVCLSSGDISTSCGRRRIWIKIFTVDTLWSIRTNRLDIQHVGRVLVSKFLTLRCTLVTLWRDGTKLIALARENFRRDEYHAYLGGTRGIS